MFCKLIISIGIMLLASNQIYAIECKEQNPVCVEQGGEREINGIKVYRDCWKYSFNKTCNVPSENNCHKISAENCQFVEERCLLDASNTDLKDQFTANNTNSNCLNIQKDFSCEKTITYQDTKSELLVSGDSKVSSKDLLCSALCIDGNCDSARKAKESKNTELGSAIGQLAALAKIKDGVTIDKDIKFDVFSGQSRSCSRKITNYTNCCAIRGWATSIGLAQCSEDDKQLAQIKNKGKCIHVGNYCSSKFLGFCVIKKEVFCCYDSLISKTVQVGARKQLSKDFGTPLYPSCQGFTLEELAKIDFDKIDYKEFFDKEITPKLRPISQEALDHKLRNDSIPNIITSDPTGDKSGFNQEVLHKYKEGNL